MFICGAKGVESVQDMFCVSDLGDQIMVPLNDTGFAGGGTQLSGKMMQIKHWPYTSTKVNYI